MPGGIILENGTKLYIGDGVMMELPRVLEVAAAALTGIGPEGDYFLAAVKPKLGIEKDNMMSKAELEKFNSGMYGIAVEASCDEGQPTLRLSASLPLADIQQLINEKKTV